MRFIRRLVLLAFVLLAACGAQAQTRNPSASLYDDDHLKSWAADFRAGRHEKVIKDVQYELLNSPSPHPFAAHVWTVTQASLGRLEQARTEIKNSKLEAALGVLPDVYTLYQKKSRYLEALKKYPVSRAGEIKDYWALSCLTVMAADMDRPLDGLAYGLAAARMLPNSYQMAWLIGGNLLTDRRVWDSVEKLVNPGGELADTEIGRYLAKIFRYRPVVSSSSQRTLALIDGWLDDHPDDARALLRRGLVASALGKEKAKAAAENFAQALRLYPFRTKTNIYWEELIAAYLKNGQNSKVEETIKMLKEVERGSNPNQTPVAEQVMITALRKAGSLDEAEKKAISARDNYPNDGKVWMELAELAKARKNKEKTIEFYEVAVKKSSDELEYRTGLMNALTDMEKWQDAVNLLDDTEKRGIKPDAQLFGKACWAFRNLINLARQAEGNKAEISKKEETLKEKARQMMDRAVFTYPEASNVMLEYAALLIILNKHEAALASLTHSFEIRTPDNWAIDRLDEISFATRSSHTGAIGSAAFSPDGKMVLTRSTDGTLRLWSLATGKLLKIFTITSSGDSYGAFSPDGKTLLASSDYTHMKLLDIATGEELKQFADESEESEGGQVAFSPNGKKALIQDSTSIAVWNIETSRKLFTIKSNRKFADTAVFSPNGKMIGTGDGDGMATLWDAETGKKVKEFEGHSAPITSLAFSPDGKTLLTGSEDETVRLWDIETEEEIKKFEGHSGTVYAVAFSPDGKSIATGGDDKTVRLWNVTTGEPMQQFNGHKEAVYSVAFSPDGKSIVTGSADKTAQVLDAGTLKPIVTLSKQTEDKIIPSLIKRFPYAAALLKETGETYHTFARQHEPDLPDSREYEKRGEVRKLRVTPASFEQLQFELKNNYPPGSAVLFYGYEKEVLYIWLLDANGPRAYWEQPLAKLRLDAVLQNFQKAITAPSKPNGSAPFSQTDAAKSSDAEARQAWQKSLLELSEVLLPLKISQTMEPVEHLLVVPLLEARNIPYAALQPFRDGECLIDKMTVSLALNLADVGNYVELWESKFETPLAINLKSSSGATADSNHDDAQAFAATSKAELIGERAMTKSALMDKMADADMLYISADEITSERLASDDYSFAISIPNKAKEQWSTTEMRQNCFSARLAFLSIRQSAQEKNGTENALEFAREFQRAGVPQVITTLWGIPDDARRLLMVNIAEELKKDGPAEAVRRTLLKFKSQHDARIWSSLVLLGTPRTGNKALLKDNSEETR